MSTASNYIQLVDETFPVKGQDNDSQGFRDNFKYIKNSVLSLSEEVGDLSTYALRSDNTTTDFSGNTIKNVNLEYDTVTYYDNGEIGYNFTVDYSLGSHQRVSVNNGSYQIGIDKLPESGSGKSGHLRLSVAVLGQGGASLLFNDPTRTVISLGSETNPFSLNSGTNYVFDIFNEDGSTDNVDRLYVKKVNDFVWDGGSEFNEGWFNVLNLGPIDNANESNSYRLDTNLDTQYATIVKHTYLDTSVHSSALALVPHRITKVIQQIDMMEPPTPEGDVVFTFDDASDILVGATLTIPYSQTRYQVTAQTGTTVTVIPSDVNFVALMNVGDELTFINPGFDDQYTVMTLASEKATTSTGTWTNIKGSIYAEEHELQVTYDNFDAGNTNTFIARTLYTSTDTSVYEEQRLIDSVWVHSLLPAGSVIMWYGRRQDIPKGWALCDGSTYTLNSATIRTPDLRNKFVVCGTDDLFDQQQNNRWVGATSSITGTNAVEGGLADSIVPYHRHDTTTMLHGDPLPPHTHTATVNDPAHRHLIATTDLFTASTGGSQNSPEAPTNYPGGTASPVQSSTEMTGITVTNDSVSAGTPTGIIDVDVTSTGTSTTGTNVPPFYALYFIMKIVGISTANPGIVEA